MPRGAEFANRDRQTRHCAGVAHRLMLQQAFKLNMALAKHGRWRTYSRGDALAMLRVAVGQKPSKASPFWGLRCTWPLPWVCSPKAMVIIARAKPLGKYPNCQNSPTAIIKPSLFVAGCRTSINAQQAFKLNMAFGQTWSLADEFQGRCPGYVVLGRWQKSWEGFAFRATLYTAVGKGLFAKGDGHHSQGNALGDMPNRRIRQRR